LPGLSGGAVHHLDGALSDVARGLHLARIRTDFRVEKRSEGGARLLRDDPPDLVIVETRVHVDHALEGEHPLASAQAREVLGAVLHVLVRGASCDREAKYTGCRAEKAVGRAHGDSPPDAARSRPSYICTLLQIWPYVLAKRDRRFGSCAIPMLLLLRIEQV